MPNSNLKPFPKGVSGNPAGRPKKKQSLDKYLDEALLEGEATDGRSNIQAILDRLVSQAKAGNTKAAEMLLDRYFGKVPNQTDITTGGQPFIKPPIEWTDPDEVGAE